MSIILYKILIKTHTLTNIFNTDMLVIIVYGGKLLFIKVNGGKAQNVVCNVCKTACISTCRKQEGYYRNVREIGV